MGYMSQEKKKKINALLKDIVPKSWKYTLGVEHHSTIVFTLRSADVDVLEEVKERARGSCIRRGHTFEEKDYTHTPINEYAIKDCLSESKEIFEKILGALNLDNFNNSDPMTDYFSVGHYVSIRVGAWDKPFLFKGAL